MIDNKSYQEIGELKSKLTDLERELQEEENRENPNYEKITLLRAEISNLQKKTEKFGE